MDQGTKLELAFQGFRIMFIDLIEIVILIFPLFGTCAHVRD
jgi:hypothetical protein